MGELAGVASEPCYALLGSDTCSAFCNDGCHTSMLVLQTYYCHVWKRQKQPSLRHVQEDVIIEASEAGTLVEHPLLDKVRACSSNPDEASDFFLKLLHPFPIHRMSSEAQAHPYLADTCNEMEAYCQGAPVRTLPYGISLFVEAQQSGRTGCPSALFCRLSLALMSLSRHQIISACIHQDCGCGAC